MPFRHVSWPLVKCYMPAFTLNFLRALLFSAFMERNMKISRIVARSTKRRNNFRLDILVGVNDKKTVNNKSKQFVYSYNLLKNNMLS